jgi:formate dehydrogenase maturation protein FdhE
MMLAKTGGPDFDARIHRAKHLGAVHSFSAEIMQFYEHLVQFQKSLYSQLAQPGIRHPVPASARDFRSNLDVAALLQNFPMFLSLLQNIGTPPIIEAARQVSLQAPAVWTTYLAEYWATAGSGDHMHSSAQDSGQPAYVTPETLTEFIVRSFLQPYAEFLAANQAPPPAVATHNVCPLCGSSPMLGVLRIEGDGGKRFLVCYLCLHEWEFRRILCPTCGEETETKLPVYVAEQFHHIRVETCETCRHYIRTIDLTKDGHAVPVVDDLAALPLTLWADEHNYSRLRPNLLST